MRRQVGEQARTIHREGENRRSRRMTTPEPVALRSRSPSRSTMVGRRVLGASLSFVASKSGSGDARGSGADGDSSDEASTRTGRSAGRGAGSSVDARSSPGLVMSKGSSAVGAGAGAGSRCSLSDARPAPVRCGPPRPLPGVRGVVDDTPYAAASFPRLCPRPRDSSPSSAGEAVAIVRSTSRIRSATRSRIRRSRCALPSPARLAPASCLVLRTMGSRAGLSVLMTATRAQCACHGKGASWGADQRAKRAAALGKLD
jgi:hypothetical protein